jgi:hypothetical protein
MFPPGRARLPTNPDPTGSPTPTMTIGIAVVAFLAASVACPADVTMTSTFSRTSSAARSGNVPVCPLRIGPRWRYSSPQPSRGRADPAGVPSRSGRERAEKPDAVHPSRLLRLGASGAARRPREPSSHVRRSIYWMSSSARARTAGGIVSPSILAVLRLITSSNLLGCSMGRSAGFAPLRILSTYVAARRNRWGSLGA